MNNYNFYNKNIFLDNYSVVIFPNCYNAYFKNGFSMELHEHERPEIMYVRKGHAIVELINEKINLERGNFVLINSNILHSLKVAKNKGTQVIMFEFQFSNNYNRYLNNKKIFSDSISIQTFIKHSPPYYKGKDTGNLLNILNNLLDSYENENSKENFMIQTLFFQLYEYIARNFCQRNMLKESTQKKHVHNAKEYINKHFTDDISINDISDYVNLNKSYLSEIFKKVENKTLFQHINQKRIERSKLLLKKAELSIMDVALYSGFNSRQYFTSIFKKLTGFSPREYRNNSLINNAP